MPLESRFDVQILDGIIDNFTAGQTVWLHREQHGCIVTSAVKFVKLWIGED